MKVVVAGDSSGITSLVELAVLQCHGHQGITAVRMNR